MRRAGDLLTPDKPSPRIQDAEAAAAQSGRYDPAVRLLDVVGALGNRRRPQRVTIHAMDAQGPAVAARHVRAVASIVTWRARCPTRSRPSTLPRITSSTTTSPRSASVT